MPFLVFARDRQLRGGRIDAGDRAMLAHHLRQQVGILPAARPQIEHVGPLDRLRSDQAAAVIARADIVMHVAQQVHHRRRRRVERAARIGLEIGGTLQDLAIIVLRIFEIHETGRPWLCDGCYIVVNYTSRAADRMRGTHEIYT